VSDAEGDAITAYQFYDSTATASSGHWTVNGVAQVANTTIDVSADQLSQTAFLTNYGTDDLSVRANDGTSWGAWTEFHVTAPANQPPVVSGGDVNLAANSSIDLSSIISVSDAENDPITAYQLYDSTVGATSAHWAVNGVEQPANQTIDVFAADLAQTSLIAGTAPGTDQLWVRANDGTSWSQWHSLNAVTLA
jgi:hypothetical protein